MSIPSIKLLVMQSERCKVSDHSPIKLTYRVYSCIDINAQSDSPCGNSVSESISKRYKYNTMSPEFLKSDTWISILDGLLNRLSVISPIQAQVDDFYNDMLSQIFIEKMLALKIYLVYETPQPSLEI